MDALARQKLNLYTSGICRTNKVASIAEQFAVVPTVEQALEKAIQEQADYLRLVNFTPVKGMQGQKIGVGAAKSIAGRTDVDNFDRRPGEVHDTSGKGFLCVDTEYDSAIKYATLDSWAHLDTFETLVRGAIVEQQARDRLTIGFNGASIAVHTDRVVNPLLQDVNKGWLTKVSEEASARYMTEGGTAGEVRVGIGAGADYTNLDQLVFDMRNNLLAPWNRANTSLVSTVSSDLINEKYYKMVGDHSETPSEAGPLERMLLNKRLGGLGTVEGFNFPDRSIMITQLASEMKSNLSIYHQISSRRRYMKDAPERKAYENYESVNEDFIVEDYGLIAVCVNIKLWDPTLLAGAGDWY